MRLRAHLVLLGLSLGLLALPASAQASHIMGGSMELTVADDRLQGTITYSERDDCTVGEDFGTLNATFTDPSGNQGGIEVPATYVRCIPGQVTASGSFDVAIAEIVPFGLPLNVENGVYRAEYADCCRIDGIENGGEDTSFAAQVTRNGTAPSSAPSFGSLPVTGIAKGFEYRQNVNAFDTNTPLSYVSQVATATGPTFDVVTYDANGDVVIPASVTSTFKPDPPDPTACPNGCEFYVYKVRVTDAQGNYAERDVLLFVTDDNTPPFFGGLPASVQVAPGETRVITFTADDDETAQTVTVSPGPLPSWASISTTPGNPATIELTLSPPTAAAGTTSSISLDAFDDHPEVPLSASALLPVQVAAPTPPETPPSEKRCFFGKQVTIEGTDGDDRIVGTPANDVILAGRGDDKVLGGGGDDLICAGAGTDVVSAGSGDDRVKGALGDDRLFGAAGDDWLRGGPGHDRIHGGPGRDRLMGNSGADRLLGGSDDALLGGPGADRVLG
jgi:hypothetical protein